MFDPYHKWLGIRPDQQPPTLYQLLGVSPEEQDSEVIEEAALRQIAHVRTYQMGPHAKECQQILNEIAQARTILVDPARRREYEARLSKTAAKKAGREPGADPAEVFAFGNDPAPARPTRAARADRQGARSGGREPGKKGAEEPGSADKKRLLIGVAAGVTGLAVLGAVFAWFFRSPSDPGPEPSPPSVAKTTFPTKAVPKPQPQPQPEPPPKPEPEPVPPQPQPQPPPPPPPAPDTVVAGGVEMLPFRIGQGSVRALAFSPDGCHLLACYADRTLCLVDTATGSEVRRFQGPADHINHLAISPDGRYALSGSGMYSSQANPPAQNCWAQLWDVNTGQPVRRFEGHTAPVRSVAFSADGRQAVTGAGWWGGTKAAPVDCTARLWDVESGKELARSPEQQYPVRHVAPAADGRRVLCGSSNVMPMRVRFWDPAANTVQPLRGLPSPRGAAFTPDGRRLLAQYEDGSLTWWDVDAGQAAAKFPSQVGNVNALAVSRDGRVGLVAMSEQERTNDGKTTLKDSWVRVLDLAAGQEVGRLDGHKQPVLQLAAAPGGARAVTAQPGGNARVWDLTRRGTTAVAAQPPKPAAGQPARVAPPDEAKQAAAEKLIRELYSVDYANVAKTKGAAATTARTALADKLRQKAAETKDNATDRYVLLREARDQAALAGDTALTLSIVEEMARWYAVDVLAEKAAALEAVGKAAATAAANKALADGLARLAEEALAADHFDTAGRLLTQAEAAARKAQAGTLVAQVQARGKDLQKIQKEHAAFQEARSALAKNPADQAAHRTVGEYLCFRKGDWDQGLPHLERGEDAALAGLAKRDQARPQGAAAQLELADNWWDLSEKFKGTGSEAPLKARSETWYRQALPGLTGLEKDNVEKRLKVLAGLPGLRPSAPVGEFRRLTGHTDRVTAVAFGRDAGRVVSGGADGTLRLWDADTGNEIRQFTGRRGGVTALAVTRDGSRLLVDGGEAHEIHSYDMDSGQSLKRVHIPWGVASLGLTPDGSLAVIGSAQHGMLFVWNLKSGGMPSDQRSGGFRGKVNSVAFHPDGKMFLYTGSDGVVHLRAPEGQRDLGKFGPGVEVRCAAFSPDRKSAVTGSVAGLIQLWNLQTGKPVRSITAHKQAVTSVVFSPDGRRLLSGGEDRTVRLWDAQTGNLLQAFPGHTDKVTSVALSPDGRRAASASDDKTVRIWSLPR